MSLEETRLRMAVRIAVRALRGSDDTPSVNRVAVFGEAYTAVARLDTGDDDWTEETLDAAWDLVREAYPKGGPIGHIMSDLVMAHESVVATADPPGAAGRRRPRRDA